jgi:hypothetical protein
VTKLIDLVGQRFTRLTVIRQATNRGRYVFWECVCDCGKTVDVDGSPLRRRQTLSCGCLRQQRMTTHGQSTKEKRRLGYGIWSSMKDRCSNSATPEYERYGGRGITVCDRWKDSFENFITDMGPRPSRSHSIERSDNDGNYEPANCHWATRDEQGQNRSNNVRVIYRGQEMPIRKAVEIAGSVVLLVTARWRVNHGWSVERAVETPSPELGIQHNGDQLSVSLIS